MHHDNREERALMLQQGPVLQMEQWNAAGIAGSLAKPAYVCQHFGTISIYNEVQQHAPNSQQSFHPSGCSAGELLNEPFADLP